jgi:IclR family transcriptional regulator, acetate operon repressor
MSQSATRRTLDLIKLMADHPSGLTLSDACTALAISKSITHRLVALPADHGFVRQDAQSGRYGLTLKLTLLGLRHYAGSGINDVSQPILDRLALATGELARLAIVEDEGLVWVAKAQGARFGLRYDPDTGQHCVLHATATGKAWLATLPEAEALRIVAATGFKTPARFSPNVARSVDQFRDVLRQTRARGYGIAMEEGEPGTAAVAATVRASAEALAPAVATLSVAGPVTRFAPHRQEVFARELFAAAEELSAIWPIRSPLRTQEISGGVAADAPEREAIQHVA